MASRGKSDPNTEWLIQRLYESAAKNEAPVWRDLAQRLEAPRSRWAEVNVAELERHASEGSTVAVPGILLGAGAIRKKLTVAAVRASAEARKKVEGAGGKVVRIDELVTTNPSGARVLLMR
jgi:large subunit ribosomal protein L18e